MVQECIESVRTQSIKGKGLAGGLIKRILKTTHRGGVERHIPLAGRQIEVSSSWK